MCSFYKIVIFGCLFREHVFPNIGECLFQSNVYVVLVRFTCITHATEYNPNVLYALISHYEKSLIFELKKCNA
jgi:hypothetical protein